MTKLLHPIQDFKWKKNISQMFGQNSAIYMKNFGIPNHNGLDYVVQDSKKGYGTPILAAHDGVVEKIAYDVPHRTRGNGIYILSSDGTFSTCYWHLSSFLVNLGDKVQAGQTIGAMGNSGWVLPRPTKHNIHAGTHLHFGVREHGTQNRYGGFVDPTPYLYEIGDELPLFFFRDLFVGKSGNDVSWLQTLLHLEGLAGDYSKYDFFGPKTLRDCIKLQKKHGLSPTHGFVGPKTRSLLNGRY